MCHVYNQQPVKQMYKLCKFFILQKSDQFPSLSSLRSLFSLVNKGEAVDEPTASVKTALCCRSKTALIPGGMARGFLFGYEQKVVQIPANTITLSHPKPTAKLLSFFHFSLFHFPFSLSFFFLRLLFPLSEVTLSGPPRAQWVHLVFFPFFLLLTQARIQIHSKS